MGIKGLLMKPVSKTDLAVIVRKVLDENRAQKDVNQIHKCCKEKTVG
jgi:YesN/AraC family two-component response regulator